MAEIIKINVIAGALIVVAVLALDAYAHVVGLDPFATTYNVLSPPTLAHVMGTDQLGRDLFAPVSLGTTFSLLVAFISVSISLSVGVVLGAFSGTLEEKLTEQYLWHLMLYTPCPL